MNTNIKVIGLTRIGIKPESTAPEADALTTRPSELFSHIVNMKMSYVNCSSIPKKHWKNTFGVIEEAA